MILMSIYSKIKIIELNNKIILMNVKNKTLD